MVTELKSASTVQVFYTTMFYLKVEKDMFRSKLQ